jgi:hypothetical protein
MQSTFKNNTARIEVASGNNRISDATGGGALFVSDSSVVILVRSLIVMCVGGVDYLAWLPWNQDNQFIS